MSTNGQPPRHATASYQPTECCRALQHCWATHLCTAEQPCWGKVGIDGMDDPETPGSIMALHSCEGHRNAEVADDYHHQEPRPCA